MKSFELQGHRGARGLKPENTLPSFEAALDAGVSAIETDLHLTCDGVAVIHHDERISGRLCRPAESGDKTNSSDGLLISQLESRQLQAYIADLNPDPDRFADQDRTETPLAKLFAARRGMQVYAIPTLCDLFDLAAAYAGEDGAHCSKSEALRAKAALLRFDLELKRVPFHPEFIGDTFDGTSPGKLEVKVVEAVRKANLVGRTTVRSFDHRAVMAIRLLEPGLRAAILIAETMPISPANLVRQADATIYCPDFRFLDALQIVQLHSEGIGVIPWTVNRQEDWDRLLDWGVDGITTDYPDRLAELLTKRGIKF